MLRKDPWGTTSMLDVNICMETNGTTPSLMVGTPVECKRHLEIEWWELPRRSLRLLWTELHEQYLLRRSKESACASVRVRVCSCVRAHETAGRITPSPPRPSVRTSLLICSDVIAADDETRSCKAPCCCATSWRMASPRDRPAPHLRDPCESPGTSAPPNLSGATANHLVLLPRLCDA